MGWRYRKSMKVGPLRLNISRRGMGQSVGVRGLRVTRTARGERYVTFSLPGTGWSYRKKLGRPLPGNRPPIATNTGGIPSARAQSPPPPAPTSGGSTGSRGGAPTGSPGGAPTGSPGGPLPDWMDDQLDGGQP